MTEIGRFIQGFSRLIIRKGVMSVAAKLLSMEKIDKRFTGVHALVLLVYMPFAK